MYHIIIGLTHENNSLFIIFRTLHICIQFSKMQVSTQQKFQQKKKDVECNLQ